MGHPMKKYCNVCYQTIDYPQVGHRCAWCDSGRSVKVPSNLVDLLDLVDQLKINLSRLERQVGVVEEGIMKIMDEGLVP